MLALDVFAQLVAADTAPKIMLVLALLVSIFGIGVVVSSRRNRAAASQVTSHETRDETRDETSHVTRDETRDETIQQDLSVRDRISKTRSSFAGAISVALTRSSITQQTWDELEEALLRADVGVTTTSRVLAPLRELVNQCRTCCTSPSCDAVLCKVETPTKMETFEK